MRHFNFEAIPSVLFFSISHGSPGYSVFRPKKDSSGVKSSMACEFDLQTYLHCLHEVTRLHAIQNCSGGCGRSLNLFSLYVLVFCEILKHPRNWIFSAHKSLVPASSRPPRISYPLTVSSVQSNSMCSEVDHILRGFMCTVPRRSSV